MLSLVPAEVQHLERAVVLAFRLQFALHADHALARRVDGELAEIGDDPLAAELLGDGGRGARTDEEVGDEIAFVGRCFDDTFEKGFGLLSWII